MLKKIIINSNFYKKHFFHPSHYENIFWKGVFLTFCFNS